MKVKQKNVFLEDEADNWFKRNKAALAAKNSENDPLFNEILKIAPLEGNTINVLEIGCGNGKRLAALQQIGYTVTGIDPSQEAIKDAKSKNLNAFVGTADELPFNDHSFDVVVFGFCLYLCDREDLFKIASEADRVLKTPGCLFILDFYSETEVSNEYHHREGIRSFKMDYSKLFKWHPSYTLIGQAVGAHQDMKPTDNKNDWTSISTLRKI